MCGISGILNLQSEESLQAKPVWQMSQQMAHRGPDDEGFLLVGSDGSYRSFIGDAGICCNDCSSLEKRHIREAFSNGSMVALGHRRLSIIDISSQGHQPMSAGNGRYWIVFNGEIYNHKEIATELVAEGVVFKGGSDTEVLLNAYMLWGESSLIKLNGDFAFAIWDSQQGMLFCARDRIGIKPFYYTIQNGQFLFASDIKTIIASGLYKPEPDSEGLYLAMAFGMAPRPMTAFRHVKALEQSNWMKVYPHGKIEKQAYWTIPTGIQQTGMKADDAIKLVEDEVFAAVKRRLVSDVPVGTFMSGGIDSTTISSIAAKIQPGIKAFTLGYEGADSAFDEVEQAQASALMAPMEHIVRRINPNETLVDLDAWTAGYEEPFYHIAPNHVISRLAKDNGVTVVLNGLGGDELFAGYDYYKWASRGAVLNVLAGPLVVASTFLGGRGRKLAEMASATSFDRLHTKLFQKTSDLDLHQLFVDTHLATMDTAECLHKLYAKGRSFSDAADAFAYMDLMNYVGNHHVHRIDQFTMAHSIEGRFPFLDHKLIEVAFRIPTTQKMHNGVHKWVLRKVAEKHISPRSLAMRKKGFTLPLEKWMKGELKEYVISSLTDLKQRDVVSPAIIDKWFAGYLRGVRPYRQIWHLVALERWFKRFIEGSSL